MLHFQKPPPPGLGNVSVPGPSLATIFSGDSEEGGHFLDSPWRLENKYHPLPGSALPFPSAGSGGPGSLGPAILWAAR